MNDQERAALMAWLDERIVEFEPKAKPPPFGSDDITIVKTAVYQGMWIAYKHMRQRVESQVQESEATNE